MLHPLIVQIKFPQFVVFFADSVMFENRRDNFYRNDFTADYLLGEGIENHLE